MSRLKPSSRGLNYAHMQRQSAMKLGCECVKRKVEVFDHPDGHPELVNLIITKALTFMQRIEKEK
jgi:hypothetical protein